MLWLLLINKAFAFLTPSTNQHPLLSLFLHR
jgi:hypothetical protein